MDRKEAIKATKNGAIAGCVYAFYNSLGAFFALFILFNFIKISIYIISGV